MVCVTYPLYLVSLINRKKRCKHQANLGIHVDYFAVSFVFENKPEFVVCNDLWYRERVVSAWVVTFRVHVTANLYTVCKNKITLNVTKYT